MNFYNDGTYGVLELTLHPGGYDWRFVPVEGETFTDSGSDRATDGSSAAKESCYPAGSLPLSS